MNDLPAELKLRILQFARDRTTTRCQDILSLCSTNRDFRNECNANINMLWSLAGFDENDANKTLANFARKCFADSRELISTMIELIATGQEYQFHPNYAGFVDDRINANVDFLDKQEMIKIENIIRDYIGDLFEYLDNDDYLSYRLFGKPDRFNALDTSVRMIRRFIKAEIGLFDDIEGMKEVADFIINDINSALQRRYDE